MNILITANESLSYATEELIYFLNKYTNVNDNENTGIEARSYQKVVPYPLLISYFITKGAIIVNITASIVINIVVPRYIFSILLYM